MEMGSRGSGERCITHWQCSRELSWSRDQLRVARLSQPEQNATHGSQATRELRATCSTGRARAPAISRRACRAPFTCRLPPAKPRPGVADRRCGAAPSRIQPRILIQRFFAVGGRRCVKLNPLRAAGGRTDVRPHVYASLALARAAGPRSCCWVPRP